VIVVRKQVTLKLGKGATFFVKSQLKRLRQEDETWAADFRALPKPMIQSKTHYLGLVLAQPHGDLLALSEIEQAPTVNDFATLIAKAMRSPLSEGAHRPRRIDVRGHHQWRELFPHLEELDIEVSVKQELPKVKEAYQDYLGQMREARRAKMVKPNSEQAKVAEMFPAIAKYVQGYGHIEIGDQEMFGFVARALGYGGLVFEDDKPDRLAEALVALENGTQTREFRLCRLDDLVMATLWAYPLPDVWSVVHAPTLIRDV
jgi:hypothetical protein